MKKIFLITGKAQHGKDTTANILKELFEENNEKTLIVHYADLLKFIAEKYLNWNGKKDDEGRNILQYIGTDVIRKQNPDMWVNFVITMLSYFQDKYDYIIIPDCRFPNEVINMQDFFYNTVLLRVNRPNFNNGLNQEQQSHKSETALDDFPALITLNNDGSIEDLRNKIYNNKALFMDNIEL